MSSSPTRAEGALRFLAEASRELASSLDYEATLRRVAWLAVPTLADWCFVDILDEHGRPYRVEVAHADPARAKLARAFKAFSPRLDASAGIGWVIRTGRTELVEESDDALLQASTRDAEHLRLTRTMGQRSVIRAALAARGRTLGAVSLVTAESGRRYGPPDLELAEELARRAAVAIDNARLYAAERQARAEAEAALRARDRFLSIASHELRTPVTTIRAAAQVLLRAESRGRLEPERLRHLLERVDRSTDRLSTLIDDLLDVSRLQSDQLPLRIEAFDLAALARDVGARFAEQLADPHRLTLEVAETCAVEADSSRVEQVLANLLDNAAKYSPDGGEIRISVGRDGDGALVAVRDPGIGLPPGAEAAIFEPFSRAPNAAERQLPGLGLGLYICRMLVERHGGRIWATSDGDGHGSTFSFWLPCTARSPVRPAHGSQAGS